MDPPGAAGTAEPPAGADGGGANGPPLTEKNLFGPSQGVQQLFRACWAFVAQNGWYGVFAAIALYVIWLQLEDRIRAAAKKIQEGPPVKADPERVQAARARQLALHQQKVQEELERRKAEKVAEVLGTEKPAPKPQTLEPRRYLSDDNVNPLFGGGGSGGSCSYRPGTRRRGGG